MKPSQQAVALTYDCAHHHETSELFWVESSLCKDTVDRFPRRGCRGPIKVLRLIENLVAGSGSVGYLKELLGIS